MGNRLTGMLTCVVLVGGSLVWFTLPGRAAEGDITGTITSSNGSEEGVWVIAETTDLPTKFIKSVVTGDGGRYLIPDLPEASYKVWVRGYGLLDSAGVTAAPGATVDIRATVAPTPVEAARVYPANYWYSLIAPPAPGEFPGTGPDGNGIAANLQNQGQWVDIQKQGCMLCHQLGNRIIRQIDNLEQFDSTLAAWDHRVKMGQRGSQMTNVMSRFGRERGLQMFADWSDRVAAGAVPPAPPRPRGVERDVVISMWEWGTEVDYIHDACRPGDGARDDRAVHARAVAVLGRGPGLERPGEPAQPDDGREGAGVDDLGHSQPGQSGLVQGRGGQSLCAIFSAGERLSVRGVLRAGDAEVRDGRHLLRDPPLAVRRRRERHALLQRRGPGHRVDRHETV